MDVHSSRVWTRACSAPGWKLGVVIVMYMEGESNAFFAECHGTEHNVYFWLRLCHVEIIYLLLSCSFLPPGVLKECENINVEDIFGIFLAGNGVTGV